MFLLEMDGLMDTQKMDNPFNTNFCNDLKKFIIEIKNAFTIYKESIKVTARL